MEFDFTNAEFIIICVFGTIITTYIIYLPILFFKKTKTFFTNSLKVYK